MTKNTRKLGRKLELMEAKAWHIAGWTVEARHPVKFVGPGKTALCDWFDRYDLAAASPERKTIVFIQVSTESRNSHEAPIGLMIAPDKGPVFAPGALLYSLGYGVPCLPGIYEVYSRWRKLKGQGWVADRSWYV